MRSIQLKASELFKTVYNSTDRVTVQQGGTSSGKTIATLQVLLLKALQEENLLISVVSESLPHLKRGALRDFTNLLIEYGIYSERMHNKSDNAFRFQSGSVIEFFGCDQPDKLRGARRDYLFINECNNIPYESYNQLEVRTRKQIYLDYNPTSEFWVHEHILPHAEYIQSTYLDNPFLDDNIIRSIEGRKDKDPNWWRVYGLGEIGSAEGLVFDNWEIISEIPESRLLGYGLDFGYTNDPTALVEVRYTEGTIYLHELIYEHRLTNDDIYIRAKKEHVDMSAYTYADSAEPKSIEELYRQGWRGCKPVIKGKDSIRNGIQVMKSHNIKVTKDSTSIIKEFRNYQWAEDKHGKELGKPIDDWNHMIDAARYCCMMTLGSEKNKGRVLVADIL